MRIATPDHRAGAARTANRPRVSVTGVVAIMASNSTVVAKAERDTGSCLKTVSALA
jgi:hypothetical protein